MEDVTAPPSAQQPAEDADEAMAEENVAEGEKEEEEEEEEEEQQRIRIVRCAFPFPLWRDRGQPMRWTEANATATK